MRRIKSPKNPAVEALKKSIWSGTRTGNVFDWEKHQNEPSIKARQGLDQLFHRALGLPQGNVYCPAGAYEPIGGGDPEALREYARIICEHVEKLNSLIVSHREMMLPLSRKSFSWPVRIARGKMMRKMLGEDPDAIVRQLELGRDTIASDPKARFDLTKKFGKVAWKLIERIEHRRTIPSEYLHFADTLSRTHCSWTEDAQKLPPFRRDASTEEKKRWLAVVRKVLEDDFRDEKRAATYRCLITAPSHQERSLQSVFLDKITGEFDSLWGLNRKPKG